MLDAFTVTFFGHREFEDVVRVQRRLEQIIRNLLRSKEYVEFLVGDYGLFDQISISAVHEVRRSYGEDNSELVMVLPYMKAEYKDLEGVAERSFDRIVVCEQKEEHFKTAILRRNFGVVDLSDLCIFYVNETQGGAYRAYRYALSQHKAVINLGSI